MQRADDQNIVTYSLNRDGSSASGEGGGSRRGG